jgi:hypothetical protein
VILNQHPDTPMETFAHSQCINQVSTAAAAVKSAATTPATRGPIASEG